MLNRHWVNVFFELLPSGAPRDGCMVMYNSAVQSQNAVTAYFSIKQLLHFGFARQTWSEYK